MNRWRCFLGCYFTLKVWSFYRLLCPSPCPVSATTAALLLYFFTSPYLCNHSCVADGRFMYVCVCLGLGVISSKYCLASLGKKENLGRSWIWSSLPDAVCIRRAPVSLSCLLLVQLGSCHASGRAGRTDLAAFLPAAPQRAPCWDSIARTPVLKG